MKQINSILFTFLIGITIINAVIPPDVENYWKEVHAECKKSSQVDDLILEKARNGTLTVDNEPLGKHIMCVGLKYKTIVKYDSAKRKDDIKLNDDGITKLLEHQPHATQEIIKNTIKICDEIEDDNVYIKTNKMGECLLKELKGARW